MNGRGGGQQITTSVKRSEKLVKIKLQIDHKRKNCLTEAISLGKLLINRELLYVRRSLCKICFSHWNLVTETALYSKSNSKICSIYHLICTIWKSLYSKIFAVTHSRLNILQINVLNCCFLPNKLDRITLATCLQTKGLQVQIVV